MTYGDADWQYEQITRLSREVEDLNYQLNTYHEYLEICLGRERERQLRFSWQIMSISAGLGAAGLTVYILLKSFDMGPTLSGMGAFFAYIAMGIYFSKLEDSDLKSLPHFPKWDPKA